MESGATALRINAMLALSAVLDKNPAASLPAMAPLESCSRMTKAAFAVRLLAKLWIFADARGLTSARKLARECVENRAFQFLADGQCPDHRTRSGFRRAQRHLVRWVFAKTVVLGRQMGLVAIDSVKLQANARAARQRTIAPLPETLGKLDA